MMSKSPFDDLVIYSLLAAVTIGCYKDCYKNLLEDIHKDNKTSLDKVFIILDIVTLILMSILVALCVSLVINRIGYMING